MKRRDYELIAKVIRKLSAGYSKTPKTTYTKKQIVNAFSVALKQENGNFEPDKFTVDCGP